MFEVEENIDLNRVQKMIESFDLEIQQINNGAFVAFNNKIIGAFSPSFDGNFFAGWYGIEEASNIFNFFKEKNFNGCFFAEIFDREYSSRENDLNGIGISARNDWDIREINEGLTILIKNGLIDSQELIKTKYDFLEYFKDNGFSQLNEDDLDFIGNQYANEFNRYHKIDNPIILIENENVFGVFTFENITKNGEGFLKGGFFDIEDKEKILSIIDNSKTLNNPSEVDIQIYNRAQEFNGFMDKIETKMNKNFIQIQNLVQDVLDNEKFNQIEI